MDRDWRDLSQDELDRAYDQAAYAPNMTQVLARFGVNSAIARRRLGRPRRLAYGDGAKESLDVFRTAAADAPVLVFIHGGAWRAGAAADYAFLAEAFVRAGIVLVIPDFDWVQDRDGDLRPLADQVQRAIAWTHRHAAGLGADPDRLYLAAHSSGAHLAGVALTCDWHAGHRAPRDLVKGALLCGGIYDLAPVRRSARGGYVAITDDIERNLSPIRHAGRISAPLILAHGTLETPEFQRQTRAFAARLDGRGRPVETIVAEHYNHFEILETLANPVGLLGDAALRLIGLAAPPL